MRTRLTLLTTIWMCAGTIGATGAVSAQTAEEHQQHHPGAAVQAPAQTAPTPPPVGATKAGMMAEDDKLTALLAKMNAATGTARVDAMAEVLTALVEKQRAMKCGMMDEMMSKMNMNMKMKEKTSGADAP